MTPLVLLTILSIYYEERNKARYKIISQKFSSDGKNIFCFKDSVSSKIQEMTCTDIANQEMIKQCSPEDAFKIGYHTAKEQKLI